MATAKKTQKHEGKSAKKKSAKRKKKPEKKTRKKSDKPSESEANRDDGLVEANENKVERGRENRLLRDVVQSVKKLRNKVYERELAGLQAELVKLQEWIRERGLKVVVLFEG